MSGATCGFRPSVPARFIGQGFKRAAVAAQRPGTATIGSWLQERRSGAPIRDPAYDYDLATLAGYTVMLLAKLSVPAQRSGQQDEPRNWLNERWHIVLMLIFIGAALIAGAKLWWVQIDTFDAPTNLWAQIAENLANGRGFTGCSQNYFPFCGTNNDTTAAREPLPVILFACLLWFTGSIKSGLILQVYLNLLVLLGIFLISWTLFGTRVALLAAIVWALYLPAVQTFYSDVNGDAIATASLTWAVLFYLRACRTPKARDWIVCGVFLAFATLSRSAVLVLVPIFAFGAAVISSPKRRLAIRGTAWLLAGCMPLISLWSIRHYAVFDQPVIGTTLAEYNLFRFNSALSSENYLHYVGPAEALQAVRALVDRRPDLDGTENEARMAEVYRQEALGLIAAAPMKFIKLSMYRALPLWFGWGVNEHYGRHDTVVDRLMMVQQGALLAAAFVGVFVAGSTLLPICILAFTLVHLPVIGRLYLILPIMPLLVTFSAVGIVSIASMFIRSAQRASKG